MIYKTLLIGGALAALGGCNHAAEKSAGNVADTNATDASVTNTASAAPADTGATGRVRGVVKAVAPDTLTVQTYAGQSATVPIDAQTGYAWVARSTLADLKNGDFIGTATTGPDSALRAVEVVIFPESMRGTGEGHYAWDTPGAVAANGGGAASSSAMTNGTVQQSAMTNGTAQQSAMTNGTVSGGAGGSGDRTLTVTYKGGKAQVLVPAGTPIVRFEPTQKTALTVGSKVFAVTPPGATTAKFVAVGKFGVTPPM